MRHLEFEQILSISIKEAWIFFSNPVNLELLFSPEMKFRPLSEFPNYIQNGLTIEFELRPFLGIPLRFSSEIIHVNPPYYFVDEQRKGPYKIWHHEHHFLELKDGVKITDKLYYSLPFGMLGRFYDSKVIHKKVSANFQFRHQKLAELFGSSAI